MIKEVYYYSTLKYIFHYYLKRYIKESKIESVEYKISALEKVIKC